MIYIFIFLSVFFLPLQANPSGHVSVQLNGQFGNQLFEIATAYAYALDHNLALTVPDLIHKKKDNIPYNAQNLFLSKIDSYELPNSSVKWKEPRFNYTKIPKYTSIELAGFFQSEKYFAHRRDEILELFAPSSQLQDQILSKYPFLSSDSLVIGIQIRDYRVDKMHGKYHPTIGRTYYEKALALFPKDAIFLVSSNNSAFAQHCTEGLAENIIYLQADYIEEFYTLTFCKSFIVSNSTFGWWAAWLCTDPNKQVVLPDLWFTLPYNNDKMVKDLFPKTWTLIETKDNEKLR